MRSARLSIRLPAHGINPSHYPLCPLNTGVNQFVRAWASLWSPEQIVRCLHAGSQESLP
jgi:hypothetical protein